MPTSPDPVDDLDDLDVEDAFGHRVSGTSGAPERHGRTRRSHRRRRRWSPRRRGRRRRPRRLSADGPSHTVHLADACRG
ncbi:hypothetical protein Q9Q99_13725 [Curtobacterium flaccumfaciens]|nr:hypothetical protein Q9Q99_13725 [Curtobacterium flaccumfaciens]